MYDAKSTNKKSEKGDRPKSADLSQQIVKVPSMAAGNAELKVSSSAQPFSVKPSPPSTHSTHQPIDRSLLPSSPSVPLSTHLNIGSRLSPKPGRITSVTLAP